MGQQLGEGVVTHAALHNVGRLVSFLHDLLPGLVDVRKAFGFLQ